MEVAQNWAIDKDWKYFWLKSLNYFEQILSRNRDFKDSASKDSEEVRTTAEKT